jgi:hypothetical protein
MDNLSTTCINASSSMNFFQVVIPLLDCLKMMREEVIIIGLKPTLQEFFFQSLHNFKVDTSKLTWKSRAQ